MGLGALRVLSWSVLVACLGAPALAAPKLRLANTAVGPVSVTQGANGPAQIVEAYNAGDGGLSLTVSSSVAWLSASVGGTRNCSNRPGTCLPIQLGLQTAPLAKGLHSGTVTVSDPNAIDAPQTIMVLVQAGGGVPDRADLYVAPNGSGDELSFSTNSPLTASVSTQSGGAWLSLSLDGGGSFRFVIPYLIRARHLPGMGEGTYSGSVGISNPGFAPDNKTVPVTLRVTSQPIARLSAATLRFRVAQTTLKAQQNILVTNRGLGTLSVTGAQASTVSGGNWLAAEKAPGLDVIVVTADPSDLSPGAYRGSVTVASNGANGPLSVPVEFEVAPQSAPLASFQGVVNNATFEAGDAVAQGAIAAVFGEQFSYAEPQSGKTLPLVSELGGAQVYVNDRPAPLYFSSYGQINFQVPYETPPSDAVVRVDRQGQRGNNVSLRVAQSAPRLLRLGIGDYGIIVNQDGTFPIPPAPGVPSRPAQVGEALVMSAIGLGQTAPTVRSGEAAPADPLARIQPAPKVFFGASAFMAGVPADPLYVGLTPGFVGLYQINVIVPQGTPKGNNVALFIESSGISSNRVQLAVQ